MININKPYEVLFIRKSNPQIGGVEMQMVRQARWLCSQGIADAVLATDDPNGPLADLFRRDGFKVWTCKMTGTLYLFSAMNSLLPLLKNSRVRIIQAHMFRESIICRVLRLMKPSLIHYFRVETYIDCSPIAEWKKNMYHFLAGISARMVNHHFANGQLSADELICRSHVNGESVTVVYNGVEPFGVPDTNKFSFDEDGCLRIIMVANLFKGKGHELLFQSIAELAEIGCRIRAYLYGDDLGGVRPDGTTYKQQLAELVKELGIQDRVVFCGFAGNLKHEMEQFQVLVLPSDSEGTPNCVLEAMSTRKLVIVSDAGELPYMVENGVSGLVHPKGDKEKLKEFLKAVYSDSTDQFETLRENGLNRWKEKFSLDAMMEQLKNYYTNIN